MRILWLILPLLLVSCSLSFQVIDTHGTATDLVDDTQTASPNVSPTVSIPPEIGMLACM